MRILFVCMGNICRSPSAEGVFRSLLAARAPQLAVEIDSAGTHDYHVGEPPDDRAIAAGTHEALLQQVFEQVPVFALLAADQRR